MKNLIKTFLIVIFLSTNAYAASDGKIELSNKNEKNDSEKDCFESLNRATFAFNQGLDKAIFKPLAKGYRTLPKPIRTGSSNVLNNITNVVTIPNNMLQGQIKDAGINSLRLVINTTLSKITSV